MATQYTLRAPKAFSRQWLIARSRHPQLRKLFESGIMKFGAKKLGPGGAVTLDGATFVRYAAAINLGIDAGLFSLETAEDVDGPEVVGEPAPAKPAPEAKPEPKPEPKLEIVPEPEPEPKPEPKPEPEPKPKPEKKSGKKGKKK